MAYERPKGPAMLLEEGKWVMEFAAPPGGTIKVEYERPGGIIRFHGQAVVRHASGEDRQDMVLVMRVEDAAPACTNVFGRVAEQLP